MCACLCVCSSEGNSPKGNACEGSEPGKAIQRTVGAKLPYREGVPEEARPRRLTSAIALRVFGEASPRPPRPPAVPQAACGAGGSSPAAPDRSRGGGGVGRRGRRGPAGGVAVAAAAPVTRAEAPAECPSRSCPPRLQSLRSQGPSR